jgi:molecular chaperone GrpE (heat shock protein)
LSGEELNPQISQMTQINADGETSAAATRPPAPADEALAAGFERLVQRVAHLEQLFQEFQNGASDISSPATSSVHADSPLLPEDHPTGQDAAIQQAWRDAPLPLRLKFVRELLPTDHPLQPVLKEAFSFEELRRNGRELETWLTGYPSLFADAVDRLERQPDCSTTPAETLAIETLGEARQTFAAAMEALGIEWILPTAGAVIGDEHEVVGEQASSVPTGRVAGLQRRGFRQRGRLLLPAQVTRALPLRVSTPETRHPESVAPITKPESVYQQPTTDGQQPITPIQNPDNRQPTTDNHPPSSIHQLPVTSIDPWPDWLRAFQQRSMGCEVPIIKQLLVVLRELAQMVSQYAAGARSEADLLARLEPLLPLLGARHMPSLLALPGGWGEVVGEARDGLLAWLSSVLDILPISPDPGDPCEAGTMQVTGTRRTAHAHEDGTVAKVERIGLRRGKRVLFRAQVLRYEMGASYE